jgi:hypothetical protein
MGSSADLLHFARYRAPHFAHQLSTAIATGYTFAPLARKFSATLSPRRKHRQLLTGIHLFLNLMKFAAMSFCKFVFNGICRQYFRYWRLFIKLAEQHLD